MVRDSITTADEETQVFQELKAKADIFGLVCQDTSCVRLLADFWTLLKFLFFV